MPYEQKEGQCGLFMKVSQKGETFYSGKILIDGKEYWINIFKNKFHSGMPGDNKPVMNAMLKPVGKYDPDRG
jgi:hypothetical protein